MPAVVKDQASEGPCAQDEVELDKGSASSTASRSSSDPNSRKRMASLVSSRATFNIGSRDTFNSDPSEGEGEYRNLSPKRPRRVHSVGDDGDDGYTATERVFVTSEEEGEGDHEEHDYASDDEISIGSQSPVSISSTRSTEDEEAIYSIEAAGDGDEDARYARLLQQQEFALAMHAYHDGLNSEAEAALLGENIHPELLNGTIDMSYEGLLRLEENLGEVKRRGLEADSLRALPRVKFSKVRKQQCQVTGDSSCSICMAEYDPTDVLIKLACDHLFHKDCAVGWLQVRATCPICRETIPEHGAL